MKPSRLEAVLGQLETATGKRATKSGNGFVTCCPAHDDKSPSLSITEGDDGRVLLHCHTGCTTAAVVQKLDMTMADLFPTTTQRRARIVATYGVRDTKLEAKRRAKATVRQMHEDALRLPDGERHTALVKHGLRSEQAARLEGMVTLAQSEAGIPIAADEFDADPWMLTVANGTVDLRTGEVRPHRRDDLATKLAPVVYDPGARSDLWDKFLHDATGGDVELVAFLQQAVGYSLTGDTGEEVLFFIHGPEATGKTTFIEAVKAMLGDTRARPTSRRSSRARRPGRPAATLRASRALGSSRRSRATRGRSSPRGS